MKDKSQRHGLEFPCTSSALRGNFRPDAVEIPKRLVLSGNSESVRHHHNLLSPSPTSISPTTRQMTTRSRFFIDPHPCNLTTVRRLRSAMALIRHSNTLRSTSHYQALDNDEKRGQTQRSVPFFHANKYLVNTKRFRPTRCRTRVSVLRVGGFRPGLRSFHRRRSL